MAGVRIENWAGLATAISPYVLPPGATVRQNNLQILRPGELRLRPGMDTVVSTQQFNAVTGLYRVSNGVSLLDDLIVCARTSPTQTTIYYQTQTDPTSDTAWTAVTASILTTDSLASPSFAEDRHGRIYAFSGYGVAPKVIDRVAKTATDVGVPAPTVAPVVTPAGNGYFIERVDVVDGGGSYWAPPPILITGGGSPARSARLKTIIQGGSIVAVDVIDGGSGYSSPPTLTVDDSGVKGSGFLGYGVIGVDPGLQGFEPVFTTTGTTASGNATVTAVAGIASVRVGASVTGTNIPNNTTVQSVDVAQTRFVMSNQASGAGQVTLTFNSPAVSGSAQNALLSSGFSLDTTSPSIAYSFDSSVTTVNGSTTLTNVASASRVLVGAVVTGTGIQSLTTVTAVNAAARTVTLSSAANASGTVTATFIQGASASFDPTLGLYGALIPLTNGTNSGTSAASAGSGSSARVFFSMISDTLSHQLGGLQDSSWPVRPESALYGASASTLLSPSGSGGYNAPDYYVNSDPLRQYPNGWASIWGNYYTAYKFPRNNTDFFAAFPGDFSYRFHGRGVTSNGSDFVNNGVPSAAVDRYHDLYMLDYSKLSLRYYTGSRAELESGTDTADKWVWTTVPVVHAGGGQPYIDIELVPAKKSGTTDYTKYSGYQTPIVRVYLKYCPDSWVHLLDTTLNVGWRRVQSGARNLTQDGYKGWWGAGAAEIGPAPRPIVDFRQGSGVNDPAGLAAGTIQVIRAGSGMEQGTFFALQFDQVNPAWLYLGHGSSQFSSDGTANSIYRPWPGFPSTYQTNWGALHKNPVTPTYSNEYDWTLNPAAFTKPFNEYRQRLYFWANQPAAGQQGPPGAVFGTPTIAIPGTGYVTNDRASFTLRQRSNLTSTATYSNPLTYTFTARQITAPSQTTSIASVQISSGGTNYYGVPPLQYAGGSGYGLQMDAVVSQGAISQVNIVSGGQGFTTTPTVTAVSQTARLLPVMRPAMRGAYRCAYRYADWSMTSVASRSITTAQDSTVITMANTAGVQPGMVIDSTNTQFMAKVVSINGTQITLSRPASGTGTVTATVRDMSKPILYSDFSPITDVDTTLFPANPNPTQMQWSLPAASAPGRSTVVEFFRTSSDQSLVFYRLEQYGRVNNGTVTIVGTDTMTDEDLFNPDRPFYAAVPVVLPNGGLNAYRFGIPRSDMAVCAAYGDRLWYAVSTSGEYPNSVFFSEFDEFESCPKENELAIQNNQKSTDSITGLIPYSVYLLVMQNSHCYGLSYNTDPTVDANINLLAHRGMLSQTCHDLFDDRLFAMDERGIYVMDKSGAVDSLSDPIRNYFDNGLLDLNYRQRFFLKVDQRNSVLRAFVVTKGSGATSPNMAFCYHLNLKCWWTESWPNGMTCSVDFRRRLAEQDQPIYGAVDGDIYRAGGVRDQAYRAIRTVTVTNGGSGYTTPPAVTVASGQNGAGAVFTAILTNGTVSEILIEEPGFGYGSYSGATFLNTVSLTIAAPPSGTTATATATCDPPVVNSGEYQQVSVQYAVRTGAMELINDGNANTKDRLQDRSVTVIYRPTPRDSALNLREYFNNSQSPRSNVMPRDRGTGFVHDTTGAKTRLNMAASRSALGTATGVATAQFAGRNYTDMGGADRHVAVELSVDASLANVGNPEPSEVLIYGLEVAGVRVNGE